MQKKLPKNVVEGGGGLKSLHGLKGGQPIVHVGPQGGRGVKKARKLVHMVYEWRLSNIITKILFWLSQIISYCMVIN